MTTPAGRPLSIVHVVCSDGFAGVERSIVLSTRAVVGRGHRVHVIGGRADAMRSLLDGAAGWSPARTVLDAARRLAGVGRVDVVHAHMTRAEAAALLARPRNGGRLVVTRHFAAVRGATPLGRAVRVALDAVDHTEIAISPFVAERIGCPSVLVPHGIDDAPAADLDARRVVMVQRLEREKDTATGLRAWARSGLGRRGWELVVAGDGAERTALMALADELGIAASVTFLGHVTDTAALRATASIQLATPPGEHFGLSVLEAMAAGLPVVVADSGAHPYLVGGASPCLFAEGDVEACATALVALAADVVERQRLGAALRHRARSAFSAARHGELLEVAYRGERPADDRTRAGTAPSTSSAAAATV